MIVSLEPDRGNLNTHDCGGSSSSGAVSSSSKLNLQLLPIEIRGALDIESELGVLPRHHVQETVLLDIDSSSDCSGGCGGGGGQKLSIDLQKVSKLDETLGQHIVTANSLLCGVVQERGWLVGRVGCIWMIVARIVGSIGIGQILRGSKC